MDTSQSGKRVLNPMLDRLDPITTQDPTEDPIADNTNEKAMNDKTTMKTYRIENKKRKEEQLEIFKRAAQAGKLEIISLSVTPKGVDMVAMHGTATEAEKSDAVEELYHNAG
jgi:hypothetical protein